MIRSHSMTQAYSTRNMPVRLLARLRIVATFTNQTIEHVLVAAIERGLPLLERAAKRRRAS